MRTALILAVYAFAFLMIWMGTRMAPPTGWPRTEVELNGCMALVLGMLAKSVGHWHLLRLGSR